MAKLHIHRYEEEIIQDLGFAFAFTNSERNELGCARKWYFSYAEGLGSKRTSHAFAWGIAWHIVMEDLFNFWKENDTEIYDDNPMFEESFGKIRTFLIEEEIDADPVVADLRIALKGYLKMHSNKPKHFKVLEVEVPLRYPIKDFRGEQFFSTLYLEEFSEHYELAKPSSLHKIETDMPFYVIGRADAIVMNRTTGELFIYDHKTTSSIPRFLNTHEIDPQLHSYAAMLEYEKTYGYLQKYKNNKIGGIIYGLTSNASTSEPNTLKNGAFSKAKSNKTPSWVYRDLIGNDESYKDHLLYLENEIDPLWHKNEWLFIQQESIERWKKESYGIARRLADMYRCLSLFENSEQWVAPRVPICKTTGFCQYKEVCINDSQIMRTNYKQENKLIWRK